MRRLDGKVAIITGSTSGQEYAALCPEANRRAAPLSSGELEVLDTADGFEVSLSGKARSWVTFLALAWVRTRVSLSRFLDMTNEEIAESFAAVPPASARTDASHVVPRTAAL